MEEIQVDAKTITVKEWKDWRQEHHDKVQAFQGRIDELRELERGVFKERDAVSNRYRVLNSDEVVRGMLRNTQLGIIIEEFERDYTFLRNNSALLCFEKVIPLNMARVKFKRTTNPEHTAYIQSKYPTEIVAKVVIENCYAERNQFALEHLLELLDDDGNLTKNPSYRLTMSCYSASKGPDALIPKLHFDNHENAWHITCPIDLDNVTKDNIHIVRRGVEATFEAYTTGKKPIYLFRDPVYG